MPPTRLPRKKDVAVALLEQSSVFVHLDPRDERVSVPAWFKKQPQLVLQVGLNMVVPIPDLHVDDDGLSCTLSFNRSPHHCVVPWGAVYALVGEDGRGMVWPDDVPPEVAAQMQQKAAPAPKPKLAAVAHSPSDASAATVAAAPAPAEAPAGAGKKGPRAASPKATASPKPAAKAAKPAKQAKPAAVAAEVPTDGKKKRTRRKPEQVKPLASVPEPTPEPTQEAAGSSGGGKSKRELPPYLRVIK